ncbi:DUF2326 domain-containing protein [Aminipila luticellarii]|uniref:DUF2326 domain-containing protein n=1 Tax=Aminipila luticellarii TaxID=2507160 RepID=A0A410PUX2_9FIRM|nr:DUF2326 domain-containing protein [Aminipila luticellarii]QAT42749.1 DUF2326 domain-containing protein [Aminipila luticellarii]
MLVEMRSPVFKEQGVERPPIIFKEGLNVILGKEDGENSIGKSSAMLAIDFVFGGNTYIESDGVKHIGNHTIFFAFRFDGVDFYFARNTSDSDKIYVCTSEYDLTGDVWTKEKYSNWLKEKYSLDFPGFSFRVTLSSFVRIYGKENTDERKPLRGIPGQGMQDSISMLVALFDRYKDVEIYNQRLVEEKKKLATYREARKYHFVSDLVGGKTKYEENLEEIRCLELQLAALTEESEKGHTEEEVKKSKAKAMLSAHKLQLETEIQSNQRKLKLLEMSLEYGLYPTEADMSGLQEYFPGVNIRKLYEVERYHKKLAAILDDQFVIERDSVQEEIDSIQSQISQINSQIFELGYVGNVSKEFLDKHSQIKGNIDALRQQNFAFLTLTELQEAKKRADDLLKRSIESILVEIQTELNEKMKSYNDSLFDDSRKAPNLRFREYNSYVFETPDDTGTGSNYKGMVIYDLAVLNCTALPAIAHDSLILKNISDKAINGIMRIYAKSTKQIFIAFDKQAAYPQETQDILLKNRVLQLSDNNCELYGQSWNKEGDEQNEDELQ